MRMWVAIFELSQFCDTCANSCCSQIIKYIPYTDNVTSKTKRWERHQKKWNLVIHFGTNVWFTARLYECHSMISNIGKSIQLYRVRYFDDTTDKLVIPVFFDLQTHSHVFAHDLIIFLLKRHSSDSAKVFKLFTIILSMTILRYSSHVEIGANR